MTEHQIWVTAVVVWLFGLFTAWCLGYATRDRHDARPPFDDLAAALAELDHLDERARRYCEAHRLPASAPVAVHVHVAAPLPWPPSHAPLPLNIPRFLDAMPVLPVEEVQS